MECELGPVPVAPKSAFVRGFAEAYLIGQGNRFGENQTPESDFQASAGSGGQKVCPENLADTGHSARLPTWGRAGRPWELAEEVRLGTGGLQAGALESMAFQAAERSFAQV